MSSGFFSISDDGRLVDVSEVAFASEDNLQELVAQYPRLLSGDERSSAGILEWLLFAREMGIPSEENQGDRWSVDHLFLDREGVPTLVEVKRSTDSRIRREVVGQLLDYAANASVFWPIETIQDRFEATCAGSSLDSEEVLWEFLGPEIEPVLFWERVKTNLQAGRLRLVFLADELPVELRRVIEFLNRQMDPTEVIGIEVKQFNAEGFKALTSRTVGRSAEIIQRAGVANRQWDEEAFFRAISQHGGQNDEVLAKRLLDWAIQKKLPIVWGKGRISGAFTPRLAGGVSLFASWTTSRIEMQFGSMKTRKPFESEEYRLELLRRLNQIPSVEIEPKSITGYPNIPFASLRTDGNLEMFFEAMEWVISMVKEQDGDP